MVLLAAGYWPLVIGYWLLATGYWLLVTGCWLLAADYWLLAAIPAGPACPAGPKPGTSEMRGNPDCNRLQSTAFDCNRSYPPPFQGQGCRGRLPTVGRDALTPEPHSSFIILHSSLGGSAAASFVIRHFHILHLSFFICHLIQTSMSAKFTTSTPSCVPAARPAYTTARRPVSGMKPASRRKLAIMSARNVEDALTS